MRLPLAVTLFAAALTLAACGDREEAAAPETAAAPAAGGEGGEAASADVDPGAEDQAAYAPVLPPQVAASGRAPSSGQAVNGYWPDGRPISAWTAAEMTSPALPTLP